jgi:hypothetical protein
MIGIYLFTVIHLQVFQLASFNFWDCSDVGAIKIGYAQSFLARLKFFSASLTAFFA